MTPPLPESSRSPTEILTEFEELPSQQRTGKKIAEVSELDEAVDTIESIDLTNSEANGDEIQPLAKLLKLKSINLTNLPMTDEALRAFADLPHLEALILDGTQVGDQAGEYLNKMPHLKSLSLRRTGITDQVFKSLAEIPELEELHLDGCKVLRGREFSVLVRDKEKFRDLRILTANDGDFGLYGLEAASKLDKLEVLSVSSSGFHNGAISEVAECKNLRELQAASTNISDDGIEPLRKLNSLRILNLAHCQAITNESFKTLKVLKGLERLDLNGTACTPNGVQQLKERFLIETEFVGMQSDATTN